MSQSNNTADTGSTQKVRRLANKRGRPKSKIYDSSDLGTPELIYKKITQSTKEPLDLYLEHSIITPNQHWCGIHLRWLYTLRYGIPGISAVDTTHLGGRETKTDDTQWREAREKEYLEAVEDLKTFGLSRITLAVCVHNEPLAGTTCLRRVHETKTNRQAADEFFHLIAGLGLLSKRWCC